MARYSWYGAGTKGPATSDSDSKAPMTHPHSAPDGNASAALALEGQKRACLMYPDAKPTYADDGPENLDYALSRAEAERRGPRQGYPTNVAKLSHVHGTNHDYALALMGALRACSQDPNFMGEKLGYEENEEYARRAAGSVSTVNSKGAPSFAGGTGGGY